MATLSTAVESCKNSTSAARTLPELPGKNEREVLQQVHELAVRLGWPHWTYHIHLPWPVMAPQVLGFRSEAPDKVETGDAAWFEALFSRACSEPDWPAATGRREDVVTSTLPSSGKDASVCLVPVSDVGGARGVLAFGGRRLPEDAGEARRLRADAGWVAEFCHRAMADLLAARRGRAQTPDA